MMNLLLVTETTHERHIGEEYNDIMVVPPVVLLDDLPVAMQKIRLKIREIVIDAQKSGEVGENQSFYEVFVVNDASVLYNNILIELKSVMENDEKISVTFSEFKGGI